MTDTRHLPSAIAALLATCLAVAVGVRIDAREDPGPKTEDRRPTIATARNVSGAGVPTIVDVSTGSSFRNHVIPVLTKAGCNSGACHGAAAGKNGFGLTLRGYDPDADYDALTRQAAGRRVNALAPARSLLLLKPTEAVPHLGGKRFEPASPEYQVLARWIAAGMPAPAASDPRLVRLEVTPAQQTLEVGARAQLQVVAHYSDGHAEDVTRWSRFSTADENVAVIDEHGALQVKGPGETALAVGFLTGVGSVRVTSPFAHRVPDAAYAESPRANFIDELALKKLRALNLAPSGRSDDRTFIRRAYLDAAGILPTPEEVAAFVADTSETKRARLVDDLLARSEFVDYWAYKWSDVLLVSSRKLGANNVKAFYGWVRESVAANKPWDVFVRELTTATGRSTEHGAVNYFLIHRNQIDLTENYTQAFLGLTLTCARCHNHPMEKWTQRDYYAFSNLFSRVSIKDDGGAKPDSMLVVSTASGRDPAPAHRRGAAADAARRRADVRGQLARTAGPIWRPGSPRRRTRCSPARSSIASGPTSSAAAWCTRPTISGPPTRPRTRSCSRRSRRTSSIAATTCAGSSGRSCSRRPISARPSPMPPTAPTIGICRGTCRGGCRPK